MSKYILKIGDKAFSKYSPADEIKLTTDGFKDARIYNSLSSAVNNLDRTAKKQAWKSCRYANGNYYNYDVFRKFCKVLDSIKRSFEVIKIEEEEIL